VSKSAGSKRKLIIALVVIVVIIVAGVAFWFLSSSSRSASNGQIAIPANGVQVSTGGLTGVGSSLNVTVENTGSVPVSIITIYVNGGAYPWGSPQGTPNTFHPDTCNGAPCSLSNGIIQDNAGNIYYNMTVFVIQPGQSITFTVAVGVPLQHGTVTVKVAGSNGAEATAETSW
jgi:hypothetical protein